MVMTKFPTNTYLDLPAWRGQRVDGFTFEWRNGITNQLLGMLNPSRDQPPQLTHDSSRAIKRQLTLNLGVSQTSDIDAVSDRVLPKAIIGGTTWPLGRYMFTADVDALSTGGDRGSFTLVDEGFAIDQQLSAGFSSTDTVDRAVIALVTQDELGRFIRPRVEPTTFLASGAFAIGQARGQALAAYATQGDYFPYWMDNDGFFRMIRTIDPAREIPDLDYDSSKIIQMGSITKTSDLLTAPNRFIVVGNSGAAAAAPLVGTYDVPPTAPHSIANRGFVIADTTNEQLQSEEQADAMARNRGIRQTIAEVLTFRTAFDPRHDSYNVIHMLDDNWLELSWSATLVAGGGMDHTVRRAYK